MTRRSLRAPWVLAAIAVGVALVLGVVMLVTGTRLLAIVTPSMSTTAPVGTLVVAQPQAQYQVGDIISFTENARIVTHRIVGESPQGFITKGDLNGAPDGWRIRPAAIIGKAVGLAPGFGFLLRALPWLLLGVVIVEAVVRLRSIPLRWRWGIRMIGWSITITLIGWWLRPWFNMELLNWRAADDGAGVLMHVVNTGLFPLSANGVHAEMGQDVVAHTSDRLPNGAYVLNPLPDLSLWWRIALIVLCLVPFLFAVLRRDRDLTREAAEGVATERAVSRGWIVAAIAAVTVVVVVVLGAFTTGAAFAASIRNSTNTVGTRTFFTCQGAQTSLGAPSTRFVYAMGTGSTTSAPDLSGNSRTGAYQSSTTVNSTPPVACPRDSLVAAVNFNGTNQCLFAPGKLSGGSIPNTFSLEAWFKTSTTSNGKIIGYGSASNSALDSNYDRHIYLDPTGRVVFGVYTGSVQVIATPAGTSYADGAWHHVVATLSSAGMALYVDGALAATKPSVTTAENLSGYWKVGCGNLNGWADGSGAAYNGPYYFTGLIRFAAVYNVALTAAQVTARYQAGTP